MVSRLRVLILEDHPADAELMVRELQRQGFEVDWERVETEEDYAAQLMPQLDLILADFSLPQFNALRALQIRTARELRIPFIIVTGSLGDETAAECIKQGAADYVLKDRLARLGSAVAQALEMRHLREKRLQAEAALRESERRYREFYDNAPDLYHTLDRQGAILNCNSTYAAALGYTKEELIGRPFSELVAPRQREAFRQALAARFAGRGATTSHERTLLRRDGTTFPVEVRARIVEDAAGTIVHVDALLRDISERKQAEEARARLVTAVEQSADCIFVTDAEGSIQYVNPAFERTTGYAGQEVLGKNARILKSGKHDATFYEEMWRTLSQGGVWRSRFTNRKKDGAIYTVDGVVSPVFDAAGKIVNYVEVARDITHQLALEAQLRHADKLASLGTLAAGATHEILNPANVISMHAQALLLKENISAELRETCDIILEQIRRISQTCDALRRFSRLGGQQRTTFSLNHLIEETLRLLRPELRLENIEVRLALDPDLPEVMANRDEIAQVLFNLYTNAKDAMPNGGTLEIRSKVRQIGEGRMAMFSVQDSGIGIPAEVLRHIFDPFFTTKPQDKGTGLGLALAHGIVEAHGGAINVLSWPGAGATFSIELPLDQPLTAAAPISPATARGEMARSAAR